MKKSPRYKRTVSNRWNLQMLEEKQSCSFERGLGSFNIFMPRAKLIQYSRKRAERSIRDFL